MHVVNTIELTDLFKVLNLRAGSSVFGLNVYLSGKSPLSESILLLVKNNLQFLQIQ